jgi:E3 ubiquitin-protein ligase DOA10
MSQKQNNFPFLDVIDNTIMYNQNSFFKNLSDHALIRVVFKDFIIYSWNILNGEDEMALNYTISPIFKDSNEEQKKLIKKAFMMNNRIKNMIDLILDKIKNEKKICIIFFQEIGQNILNDILKNNNLKDYRKLYSDSD